MVPINEIYALRPYETQDTYLYRLGCLKDNGTIQNTWDDLAGIFNNVLRPHLPPWDKSSWRKRFRRLQLNPPKAMIDPDNPDELPFDPPEGTPSEAQIQTAIANMQRERAIIQDVRASQNRIMRQAARTIHLGELFSKEIKRFTPLSRKPALIEAPAKRAMYALLGDIHYGIAFNTRAGIYNPDIAKDRVLEYADRLTAIGFSESIDTIYVSLMGDMVSGIIHQTIRLENREDLVKQVVGVSELVSEFLHRLGDAFAHVYVNAVPGNHSRVDQSFGDAMRGEKVDTLIPWYCKAKLEKYTNITFVENTLDSTIGTFDIFGKTYVSVHGDMDSDLRASAQRIEHLLGKHIDTITAGHTHIFEARMEHTNYIRNGSICGSGDEYTMKKRLYGPAVQVCMLVSEQGVESVTPIRLDLPKTTMDGSITVSNGDLDGDWLTVKMGDKIWDS